MKNLALATVLSFVGITAFANVETPELENNNAMEIVQGDFEEISVSDLPSAVTGAVESDYPTATISKAYKNDQDQYKLDLTLEDGTTGTVYADAEGNWIDM
ncbi:hypothetical protein GO009_04120 [Muricauda sp. TY007]|uniref:hypothetical protein n=1 Tax=Allomuricauda sp. TY007 TaxID=2683200 RepID=UPI0013C1C728|nr:MULTISPECIES: hypothetical protein [unclassified Allomuricauda]MBA4745008.1 hypothetical protein [Allomuricauda sp.]NDV15201.1 hypothetical protein [Muricauda sp. TY007]